jgi:hypothetical protein
VTRTMREQPHTTPVTTTWTADFLTREGEGRKAMSDWLHDKLIPWKARRRLLQTNSGTFPCESRPEMGQALGWDMWPEQAMQRDGFGTSGRKTRPRHHRSPAKQRVQTSSPSSHWSAQPVFPASAGEQGPLHLQGLGLPCPKARRSQLEGF